MKNRRPEVAASGLFLDNRKQPEAPSKCNSIYIFFRLFARSEVWILFFLKKFNASTVGRYFMCVGAVFGGRSIAVIYVVGSPNKRLTENLRGAIGKRKKVVKPTVRVKKDGG
jgi:hypothetical protein